MTEIISEKTETKHKTVLLNESIEGLHIVPSEGSETTSAGSASPKVIVDATVNGGGHSEAMIERYGRNVRIIGIDLDQDALRRATERLAAANERAEQAGKGKAQFTLHQANFRQLDSVLKEAGIKDNDQIDGILYDLGLSSNQFEDSGRGFSFRKDEPLSMSFTKTDEKAILSGSLSASPVLTAYEIVNSWDEANIADIIYGYGEERYAKRIARNIVEARASKPISTTFELVEVIRRSVPFSYAKAGPGHTGQKRKTHFATKTFQALRITVNDEIQALREGLQKGFDHLRPGGRMAVISFHSLEDRIVKRFFIEQKEKHGAKIITKKPTPPSDAEVQENRRSRSAKLRVLEK